MGDYPSGKKGDVLTVEFNVAGVSCIGINGGPMFKHNSRSRSPLTIKLKPTAIGAPSSAMAAKRAPVAGANVSLVRFLSARHDWVQNALWRRRQPRRW